MIHEYALGYSPFDPFFFGVGSHLGSYRRSTWWSSWSRFCRWVFWRPYSELWYSTGL